MNHVFRKLTDADCPEITAFKEECTAIGSGMDGTGILFRATAEEWLASVRAMEARDNPNTVPCLQYGLFREDRLLGLLQIRLELKGYLIEFGGHIGYCVRPCERRKGCAKEMLRAALDICRTEGLDKVLVTCLENNIGSARTIESCGGALEKIVFDHLNYQDNMKRYWIAL